MHVQLFVIVLEASIFSAQLILTLKGGFELRFEFTDFAFETSLVVSTTKILIREILMLALVVLVVCDLICVLLKLVSACRVRLMGICGYQIVVR